MVTKGETMTNSNNNSSKNVNVNNITIPLVTIVSIISFAMWGTYEFAKDRQTLKDELQKEFAIELRLQREAMEQIRSVIITIREKQQYQIDSNWTKIDHHRWCMEAQKKNAGFVCPEYNPWENKGGMILPTSPFQQFGTTVSPSNTTKEEQTNNTVQEWSRIKESNKDISKKE